MVNSEQKLWKATSLLINYYISLHTLRLSSTFMDLVIISV